MPPPSQQELARSTAVRAVRARDDYTVTEKGATLFLPVTLRNANRLSKFFYHHTMQ